MSLVYAHTQGRGLVPDDVKYNPVRPPELGGWLPLRTSIAVAQGWCWEEVVIGRVVEVVL